MSTQVSMVDEAAIQAAIADVRNDDNQTTYLVCGHQDGDPNLIELRTTGSDTTEIGDRMQDSEVLYCLARYTPTFEMSTVTKFVFIHWIGERVPFSKKGRFGVVFGNVEKIFECGHHLSIETSTTDDLDKDKIIKTLNDSMGTTNKVLDNEEVSKRQMRGFTQTQLPQKSNRPQFNVSAVSSKGHNLEIPPEVHEAVAKVRSDTEPEMWMVAGYQDINPKGPMVTLGTGTGGVSDLKEILSEEQPMYGLLKVNLTNADAISVVKFVYIMWVGGMVKPMTKAKISTHKGTMEEIFTPAHVTIFASSSDEISESIVMDKVKASLS